MASTWFQHGLFDLFGIVWLLSMHGITGGLEMHTIPKYLTTCGENVTLRCTVISKINLRSIKFFYWMKTNEKPICYWNNSTNQTDTDCKISFISKSQTVDSFQLTIFNVQPKHQGTYHCKLHAKEGMKDNEIDVRVQMCYGSPSRKLTDTELTVTFPDVFPRPRVLWSRGQDNLTLQNKTNITENTEGKFTVVSSIKRDLSQPLNYTCSLLMDVEKENETVEIQVQSISFSGGYMVHAHWFSVMLVMVWGSLVQYCGL